MVSAKTCTELLLQPLNYYAIPITACPAGPVLCKLNGLGMVKERNLGFSFSALFSPSSQGCFLITCLKVKADLNKAASLHKKDAAGMADSCLIQCPGCETSEATCDKQLIVDIPAWI